MSFIKIHPLQEIEAVRDEDFGMGNPARCNAVRRFDTREIYLNVNQIAAFEECPLYLVCEADPNALVNGIRIRLASGGLLVVADDPGEDEPDFLTALGRACRGEVAEVPYSRHLRELERDKLL